MYRRLVRSRAWWLWLGCGVGGWLAVSLVSRPLVQVAILGRQSAYVAAPWDLASLDIFGHLAMALVLGIVAALFVGLLRFLTRASSSVWFGAALGAAILLAASYGRYAPGSWPATAFAVEEGIPALGAIAGAYVGSRLTAKRVRTALDREQHAPNKRVQRMA
jgi:hypothetical protein